MWKIYYGDYSTYSDQDGPPWESPIMDVQVIAVPDSVVGKRLIFSHSYYIYKDDGWLGVDDSASLVLHLLKDVIIINTVRAGLATHQENFKDIMRQAKEDGYLV
jgi:hypothetical protein